MHYRMIFAAAIAMGSAANASPAKFASNPAAEDLIVKRQSMPVATSKIVLKEAKIIGPGETFDGKMAMYDRGTPCTGQQESGDSAAVFIIQKGGTLSNVIIGSEQSEGVHCMGNCTVNNVWWSKVCEDAFTIKVQEADETTYINGGGAFNGEDKIIQMNGGGRVFVRDFLCSGFGKCVRSCGNCRQTTDRHIVWEGGQARNGKVLIGINSNLGDTATINGVAMTAVDSQCTDYKGVAKGSEPTKLGPCKNVGGGGGSGGGNGTIPYTPSPNGTDTGGSGGDGSSGSGDGGSGSGKKPSGKKPSGKKSSDKKPSGKKPSGKKPSGKKSNSGTDTGGSGGDGGSGSGDGSSGSGDGSSGSGKKGSSGKKPSSSYKKKGSGGKKPSNSYRKKPSGGSKKSGSKKGGSQVGN